MWKPWELAGLQLKRETIPTRPEERNREGEEHTRRPVKWFSMIRRTGISAYLKQDRGVA